MSSWFTTEIIDKDTFAISEYRHWEETHCYLLCGTKKAILIDTGLGVANIKKVVDSLTSLPVTAITHIYTGIISAGTNILILSQSTKQKKIGYLVNFLYLCKW